MIDATTLVTFVQEFRDVVRTLDCDARQAHRNWAALGILAQFERWAVNDE